MGKTEYHHQVISLNPAWCLRPPPPTKTIGRRRCSDNTNPSCDDSEASKLSSPRVTCMGQIKRDKSLSESSIARGHNKLFMLWRFLSGRKRNGRASSKVQDYYNVSARRIMDFDRRLPVVSHGEREAKPVSLWERRCGGNALQGFQLQQLNICLDLTAV